MGNVPSTKCFDERRVWKMRQISWRSDIDRPKVLNEARRFQSVWKLLLSFTLAPEKVRAKWPVDALTPGHPCSTDARCFERSHFRGNKSFASPLHLVLTDVKPVLSPSELCVRCGKRAFHQERGFSQSLIDQDNATDQWRFETDYPKALKEGRPCKTVESFFSPFLERQRSAGEVAHRCTYTGASVFHRRQTFCESAARLDGLVIQR